MGWVAAILWALAVIMFALVGTAGNASKDQAYNIFIFLQCQL